MKLSDRIHGFLQAVAHNAPLHPTWLRDRARELLAEFEADAPALTEPRAGADSGTATSRRAAAANFPRSGTQRGRVLEAVAVNHPLGITREQLEVATRLDGNTLRPRVCELIDGGWIMVAHQVGRTLKGNDAEVLVLTEKGVHAYDAGEHRHAA